MILTDCSATEVSVIPTKQLDYLKAVIAEVSFYVMEDVMAYEDTEDATDILREKLLALQGDAELLAALNAAGVDNWEGYSEALCQVGEY